MKSVAKLYGQPSWLSLLWEVWILRIIFICYKHWFLSDVLWST